MTRHTTPPWHEQLSALRKDEPFDPLRLCIFATVALLGWIAGPFALLVFATLGLVAYTRARRAGLKRSKCYLRDTRLVIGYLALLVLAAVIGIIGWLTGFDYSQIWGR